jgi:hypothetical protein
MGAISNALGISNGFTAQSAAGPNGQITQNPNLTANAQAANTNYSNVNALQAALANQYLAQSQGQGPNLAGLELAQATNQNNQQAAGAMASNRGMNPALAQRIIAQNQAMNNQNAAGQAGILRAQQQYAAQSALANMYNQQAGEANTNLAANESALSNQNNAIVSATNAANQANAQIAQNNTNQNAGITSGVMNGIGSMASMLGADGGEVPHDLEPMVISKGNKVHPLHLFQGGDMLSNFPTNAIDQSLSVGPSAAANNLFGATAQGSAPTVGNGGGGGGGSGGGGFTQGIMSLFKNPMSGASDVSGGSGGMGGSAGEGDISAIGAIAAHGGQIPVMLSPGELKIPAHKVRDVMEGRKKASEVGERIPGKAKVKGDSLKNDTYMTHANAGDVIVKRTKAQNDEDAREFLLAIKADKDKKSGPSGYAKVLIAKRKNA